MRATLLTEELIARKSQQLKPLLSQLVMHLSQQFVVGRCQPSLTCYIDHQYSFLVFEGAEVHHFAIYTLGLNIEEGVRHPIAYVL